VDQRPIEISHGCCSHRSSAALIDASGHPRGRNVVPWLRVLVAVGCSGGSGVAGSAPPAATSTSVSATPDAREVEQRLVRATLTDDDMAGQGAKPEAPATPVVTAENVKYALVHTCNIVPPSNTKIRGARQARWYVPRQSSARQMISGVEQMTVSYKGVSGAEAIADIRRMLTCGTYANEADVPLVVTGGEAASGHGS
jgi:hypothetical protein